MTTTPAARAKRQTGAPAVFQPTTKGHTRMTDDINWGKPQTVRTTKIRGAIMLEGGCDVRLLQEILGHVEMSTTAIYTRISIKHLKKVHEQTHPAAWLDPEKTIVAAEDDGEPAAEDLLEALDGEGEDDDLDDRGR